MCSGPLCGLHDFLPRCLFPAICDIFIDRTGKKIEIFDEPDAVPCENVKGDISFRNVSFAYPDDHNIVFRDLNLDIHAGEKIAIVGPSGGGKTTLFLIIFFELLLFFSFVRKSLDDLLSEQTVFANFYMAYTGHVMGTQMETDMRRDAYAHLQRLSDTYYNNTFSFVRKSLDDLLSEQTVFNSRIQFPYLYSLLPARCLCTFAEAFRYLL